MKKKYLIMMAVVTIICSLVSCGKSEDDERETKKSAKETTVEEKNDAVSSDDIVKEKVVEEAVDAPIGDMLTGDAPVGEVTASDSIDAGAVAADALVTYTFANAKVTVTDIMKVEDSASYPNYVPATELGYESISADYEWFFQNNEQMKDIACESTGQVAFNNQDIIFAGLKKIAAENDYGEIVEMDGNPNSDFAAYFESGNYIIVAVISHNQNSNYRIAFINGYDGETLLTTDIRR